MRKVPICECPIAVYYIGYWAIRVKLFGHAVMTSFMRIS